MKCFDCGSSCVTVYQVEPDKVWLVVPHPNDKILAVRKECLNCEWYSYPTIIPTTRQKILLDFDE
jgi:hypothetical protein